VLAALEPGADTTKQLRQTLKLAARQVPLVWDVLLWAAAMRGRLCSQDTITDLVQAWHPAASAARPSHTHARMALAHSLAPHPAPIAPSSCLHGSSAARSHHCLAHPHTSWQRGLHLPLRRGLALHACDCAGGALPLVATLTPRTLTPRTLQARAMQRELVDVAEQLAKGPAEGSEVPANKVQPPLHLPAAHTTLSMQQRCRWLSPALWPAASSVAGCCVRPSCSPLLSCCVRSI
jgi:hypothetical protein